MVGGRLHQIGHGHTVRGFFRHAATDLVFPLLLFLSTYRQGHQAPFLAFVQFNRALVVGIVLNQAFAYGSGCATCAIAGAAAKQTTQIAAAIAAMPLMWEYGMHDYQRTRVLTLLDPTKDPLGAGYHILQSMIAIGSGGVWGKGFMRGTQTHLEFIPERTTDFIFAAFAEEFGLLGNIVLLLTFLFLIYRILWIAAHARGLFERLLAAAIGMTFFSYAFVNMGMVSGILPVVGVPLPFISYGGTAMVTLGLAVGMLMSIARAKRQA